MKSNYLSLLMILALTGCQKKKATKLVCISQSVSHPALDQTVRGVIDGLAAQGFEEGKNIHIQTQCAQGNASLAGQIAAQFFTQNPDVMVSVGTLSSQSFMAYSAKGTPVVYASVTDPVNAGLISKKGNTLIGVSNFVPLLPQIELIQKIQPSLKKLGILYNPAEANSVVIVKKLKKLCQKQNLTLVDWTVSKTSDIAQACSQLAGQVDAIIVNNDNTVLSAIPSVCKGYFPKPVYVSDTDVVNQGALAAQGPDQKALGVQAGNLVSDILKGKDLSGLEVQYPSKTQLYLNQKTAADLNISFPPELTSQAQEVIAP